MKNLTSTIIVMIILAAGGCSAAKTSGKAGNQTIRILTYNVRNCLGMDGKTDYKRVADVIKIVNPDIVALQELDSATLRSKGAVVLNELARLSGMHSTYGGSIEYQGGKYGVGILSREKPLAYNRVTLPGKEEPRSLLIVELDDLVIGCTHFSLTEADRLASAQIINNTFKNSSRPVFIAGDFNAVPESPVIKSLENKWVILNDTAAPTIPSDNPKRCIDYIMVLKAPDYKFRTKQAVVVQEPVASDHLPVWVQVNIEK